MPLTLTHSDVREIIGCDKLVLADGREITATNDFSRSLLRTYKMLSSDAQKDTVIKRFCECVRAEEQLSCQSSKEQAEPTPEQDSKLKKINVLQRIIDFFREFDFDPSYRFVNSLAYICAADIDSAKTYVKNYFAVSGSINADSVAEKVESREFGLICNDLSKMTPTKPVNTRLTVLYGPAGTGKTTRALEISEGRCVVCHSAMLPQDLMEDFDFVDGKSTFKPSALQQAIVRGEKITMDEFNLLPFESLRFMQSLLDGKEEFMWKGKTIRVAPGFEVIATMNLRLGGQVFGLPEPLVDRASVIDEMKLSASDLLGALS